MKNSACHWCVLLKCLINVSCWCVHSFSFFLLLSGCKRRKNASSECRNGRFPGSRVLLMLDARSADYIPSKATLGHSQGHSILPNVPNTTQPPPHRFVRSNCILHFNTSLLWHLLPGMLLCEILTFNHFNDQNIWHRERFKKKKIEKKLTNVSFMYVCVAGNGEMLVFFSRFFPQQ